MTAISGTEPSAPPPTRKPRGFTLLEIMLTITLVGVTIIPLLLIRERTVRQSYRAHHLNTARTLARELLSELEFHELDQMQGEFDGYPGFSYSIEVEEVDLVTGEEEEDEDNPYSTSGNYQPADKYDPENDEEEEMDYPVRRVTLTLKYPNLKESASDEPEELKIVTIFPPLPNEDDEFGKSNPFN